MRSLSQEGQHDKRVRLQPCALADLLGFKHILLCLRLISHLQIQGGQAIVAGE